MNEKLRKELAKHVRNNDYEPSQHGIFVLPAKLFLGGTFIHNVFHPDGSDEGWVRDQNLVVNEGLDHALDVILNGASQIDPWYIAIYEGNVSPSASWDASNVTSNSTENTTYDESTRVEYVPASVSSQSITNSANSADFTMNATKTIYGAFIASASAKSATTGTLLAAAQLSSSRAVESSDVLSIVYQFDASDA